MNKELLGATILFVLFTGLLTVLFISAPTIDDIQKMPDKPLTTEQQEFYGN